MGVALDTGGAAKRKGVVPNINVTPLVDIVLVLLIIFMVVIPNMQDGKSIEMVKVESADPPDGQSEPLVVTVALDQICTYEKADMSIEQCVAKLHSAKAENARRRVLIRGDAGLPYRVMRGMFYETQQLGYAGVSLAVGVAREWTPEGT